MIEAVATCQQEHDAGDGRSARGISLIDLTSCSQHHQPLQPRRHSRTSPDLPNLINLTALSTLVGLSCLTDQSQLFGMRDGLSAADQEVSLTTNYMGLGT